MRGFYCAASLCICVQCFAQSSGPKTENQFYRRAGLLLAASTNIYELKRTKCGYAIYELPPSFDQLVQETILPKIPLADQRAATNALIELKPKALAQSKTMVANMIADLTPKTDQKTACGQVAGALTTVYGVALDRLGSPP